MKKTTTQIEKIVLMGAVLTSLIFTPNLVYYPFITPKFTLLILFGTILFFIILINRKNLFNYVHLDLLVISFSFLFWMMISLLLSKVALVDGLFGLNNRNDGVISYFYLLVFMTAAMLVSGNSSNLNFLKCLLLVGVISTFYGLFQGFGYDFFEFYQRYNTVIGFFGNPNFQSAFLGISSICSAALIFRKQLRAREKFLFSSLTVLQIFVIYQSESTQGLIIFFVGILTFTYLWVKTHPILRKFHSIYLGLLGFAAAAFVVDLARLSPWKSFFYEASISFRGDFWRAAINMLIENPLFGVGITGFRDQYRASRDITALSRSEFNQVVESPHNKLLDIASSGGVPLLLIYMALIFLVLLSAIRVIKRSDSFDHVFATLFACWVAYQAQTLIGIFSFGIEIFGWILGGLIIGYEKNTRDRSRSTERHIKLKTSYPILLTTLVGTIFLATYFQSELRFKSAVEAGEINKIMSEVQQWPQRNDRYNLVVDIFNQGGFPDQAVMIAKKAIILWPNNFEAWQTLFLAKNTSEFDRTLALENMRRLDPLNPTLKENK